MAGIGFELKKLFSRKGLIATIRAYSYATLVCTGPMILGFLLLLVSTIISNIAGAPGSERELLVSMLTHALLGSLIVTSVFSMVTTRFCADMIYEKKYDRIFGSFFGSLWFLLIIGGLIYAVFLFFSGIELLYRVMSWIFFMIMIVVWTEIGYLNMLKDYRSIMKSFSVSIISAWILGIIFIWVFHMNVVTALFLGIIIGYSIMLVWCFALLYRYFPEGFGSCMRFLEWFDKTPELGFIGFLLHIGLFSHILIMWWVSDLSVQVKGLFYGAPMYDVPAIIAFFSILITTVNFTTFVETRFYPRYKEYFSLFNDGGSIESINEAEVSMVRVLADELGYLSLKQFFSTIIFIFAGTVILPVLPLGFNGEMLKIFRNLCIGYAFYALGNSFMLISQYFSDLRGALYSSVVFGILSTLLTLIFSLLEIRFYGLGFIIGGIAFSIIALLRLIFYLKKLKFNVLSKQPLIFTQKSGFFTHFADFLDKIINHLQKRRKRYANKYTNIQKRI